MTQNIQPYFGQKGVSPFNLYKPGQIPFEAFSASQQHAENFEKLVKMIKNHRKSQGKNDMSKAQIREKLLEHTHSIGLQESAGMGMWSDVFSGLKTIGNSAVKGVSSILENPLGSLSAISPLAALL